MTAVTAVDQPKEQSLWQITVDAFMSGTRRFYEPLSIALQWYRELWLALRRTVSGYEILRHDLTMLQAEIETSNRLLAQVQASIGLSNDHLSAKLNAVSNTADELNGRLDNLVARFARLEEAWPRLEPYAGVEITRDFDSSTLIAKEVVRELVMHGFELKPEQTPSYIKVFDPASLATTWGPTQWRSPLNLIDPLSPFSAPCVVWNGSSPLRIHWIEKDPSHSESSDANNSAKKFISEAFQNPLAGQKSAFDGILYEGIQEKIEKRK